jgi:AmmeMemoRadiSam system protein B
MPDPEAPRRPLIIPGAEDEPASPPRIILPGGEPASHEESDAPRPSIVLPPGVEAPEDVPEYPRLRPLVLLPVRDGTRELLLVSDPMGVVLGQPVLSIETLPILQLLDGTTALSDITAAIMRESKDLRVAGAVRDFIAQLDQMLLLDSPRFQRALQAMRDAYHPLEIRPAALEDRSYPGDRAELEKELDAHFTAGVAMRDTVSQPTAAPTAVPRAIMAPHLDPRRAGAVIARAYLELGAEPAAPLRVVVFGTGHSLMGDLFALTRKHFQTPLGKATCDTAFVDRVAAPLGEFAYRGELAHREEHSIEFQVLYLQHRLRGRVFTIVPILCGGFHALLDDQLTPRESPEFETLIDAVREAESALGGTTLYVAGIDLSHVGPRFGDPPIDARVKQETEVVDRAVLDAALAGDADGWFNVIAAQDDRTRICGFAPTYAMLRCSELRNGRLLRYEQSDDPDGSMVSVAAAVWDPN